MRILIDIGHPAHVHLFRNFAKEMQLKGHSVLFTCREKEFEIQLLEKYGFQHISFGRKYNSIFGKLWGLIKFDFKEFIACLKFKPDILLSHGSIYAAHAAFLLGKPHVSFEDTFNFEQVRLYRPFTKHILTGNYEHPLNSKKVINYSGYHELAYLHPNNFKADRRVLKELGVEEDEPYVIMRFSSWQASHDIGHGGISLENKKKAISSFSRFAKIFISSEADLPKELQQYKFPLSADRMHDAMAFCSLMWGETYTMPAECSVLGVPSIIIHNPPALYLKEQEEKYELCFNFSESQDDQQQAIVKGEELLQTENLREVWNDKRDKMLADKIDVTAFLVWFVENYPESVQILKENPEYQYRFR